MTYKNHIELSGKIVNIDAKILNENILYTLTLLTETIYNQNHGASFIQTDFHTIEFWKNKHDEPRVISKMDFAEIEGSLQYKVYLSESGNPIKTAIIKANKIKIL